MARNLDEFANELTQVTAQVIQASTENAKAKALHTAVHKGDTAAAQRIADSMTTEQLQRIQAKLRA